jgi:hypothetical protein
MNARNPEQAFIAQLNANLGRQQNITASLLLKQPYTSTQTGMFQLNGSPFTTLPLPYTIADGPRVFAEIVKWPDLSGASGTIYPLWHLWQGSDGSDHFTVLRRNLLIDQETIGLYVGIGFIIPFGTFPEGTLFEHFGYGSPNFNIFN